MVVTMTAAAGGIKNDVAFFKAAEVQGFIKSGPGMIWQRCKIHSYNSEKPVSTRSVLQDT